MFKPDCFKTERLVCVEKDGQKDGKVDSSSDADQEYIYSMKL